MNRVLFVCLGNICRSPLAHGVFETMVEREGLSGRIEIDSCGTGAWHVGEPPDRRMQQVARQQGYDISHLRARKLEVSDFDQFDVILTMDTRNMADVIKIAPAHYSGTIQLFLDYHPDEKVLEVPDPYYGKDDGFEYVFQLVETASQNLLEALQKK